MELVLILSSLIMYYITKKYDAEDWFENFYLDVFVQFLHIVTLFFICTELFKFNSIVCTLCFLFSIYVLSKNVLFLILNILSQFLSMSIEDDNEEKDNDDDDSDNDEGER